MNAVRWRGWLPFAGVMALALALRLYGLAGESAWYDEVITMAGTDRDSLEAFFSFWRYTNWNAVPVYYTLQFAWAKAVSDSVVSFRLMSIGFGMGAVAITYALGSRLGGRAAGLLAAACVALSAVHIYQAQEVRNYALTTLAAGLTAYTFIRLIEDGGKRWWALNTLANLLLVWTHLFGCFLLVACGLSWLAAARKAWPRAFAWGCVNLVLMIPSVLWIQTFEDIQYYSPPIPPLWHVVNNMFTDVWSPTFNYFMPAHETWQFERHAFGPWLESVSKPVDLLLLGLFAVLALYVAGDTLARARRGGDAPGGPSAQSVLFLVLWLVVPAVCLWTLAQTWRSDILSPKYTTYSSIAAYLLAGLAVSRLPGRWPGAVLAALLVLGLTHHWAAAVTHPQRPPWYAAAAHIQSGGGTADSAFVIYPAWQKITLEYNLRPQPPAIEEADSLEEACLDSERLLGERGALWFVWVGGYGNRDFVERYERFFAQRGDTIARSNFWGGMQTIFVCRITRNTAAPMEPAALEAAIAEAAAWEPEVNDGTTGAIPIQK
jgi:4-amino-4-deoxy-L-arabinose transferase-like glycosyltransferase